MTTPSPSPHLTSISPGYSRCSGLSVIRGDLPAVARYTELTEMHDVESHLLFRNPVPMEFAFRQLAEKVAVSHFGQLDSI